MSQNPIPFYHLYGDDYTDWEPRRVHLESIATRSRKHRWEIKPHRHHKLAQIVCVFNNELHCELDSERYCLSGNWLIMIPPGVVHGFLFQPDTAGVVLSVDSDFLAELSPGQEPSSVLDSLWFPQPIEIAENRDTAQFRQLLGILEVELNSPMADSRAAMGHLMQLLLIHIRRQQRLDLLQSDVSSRETQLLVKFRRLIEAHYQQHLAVKDYADKLFVSVSTLSRVCQTLVKTSPKQLIRQRLLNESKIRLVYTRQSIEQIADTLGYKDVGYFCRQFKAQEKLTAGEYRKHHAV